MGLYTKTVVYIIQLITILWLCSKVVAAAANDGQIVTAADADCIENDLSTRRVMRRALGRSVLGSKPDLFSLFSRVSHHRGVPPIAFDYANMIQNDVILLDDSIETKTRKRGSVLIPPTRRNVYRPVDTEMCNSCTAGGDHVDFGASYYPRRLYQKICNLGQKCSGLYTCQPIIYYVKLLTSKMEDAPSSGELPPVLQKHWTFHVKPVTVACLCTHPDIN